MINGADPCAEGLTKACFLARPEQARQVFAYRLLGMLIGPGMLKRLQTFKGVPLPVSLAAEMGGGITDAAAEGAVSAVGLADVVSAEITDAAAEGAVSVIPPTYVQVFEAGPIHITQAIEGEIIMSTIRKAKIDISTAAAITVIAAVSGFKISISSIVFTVAGETNITLKSGTTAISGAMDFGGTNEPMGMSHGMGDMPLQTAEGEAFVIDSSLAVQVSGWITYYLS